jgi:hypothetical protein
VLVRRIGVVFLLLLLFAVQRGSLQRLGRDVPHWHRLVRGATPGAFRLQFFSRAVTAVHAVAADE